MPYGLHEWVKFFGCLVAGYVFFRGICVIINNTCCRVIEWAGEEVE